MYSPPKESTLEGVIGILVPSARIFLLAFRSRSPFGRRTVSIGLRVLPLHHIAQQERSRDVVRSAAPQLDDRVRIARQPARTLQLLSLPFPLGGRRVHSQPILQFRQPQFLRLGLQLDHAPAGLRLLDLQVQFFVLAIYPRDHGLPAQRLRIGLLALGERLLLHLFHLLQHG